MSPAVGLGDLRAAGPTEAMFEHEIPPADVIAIIAEQLTALGAGTQRVGGTLGFRIQGPAGGDWLVDLSSRGGRWTRPEAPEGVERATTTIYAYPRSFQELITHPAEVERWIRSGTLEVDGDRSRLLLLGRLLGAQGSILQHRAQVLRSEDERSHSGRTAKEPRRPR